MSGMGGRLSTSKDETLFSKRLIKSTSVRRKTNHLIVTGSPTKGGLTMFNTDSVTCPEFIVSQSNFGPQDTGILLVFLPQDPAQTYVQYGFADYNVGFKYLSVLPKCRRLYTTVWTVAADASTVMLDGEKGDEISWFKIKKSDDNNNNNGYVIRYSSTSLGGSTSKDVGVVSNENGVALLSLDDGANPLVVEFIKA